ncbi:MAG: EamA family transporter [Pirellula sp.]
MIAVFILNTDSTGIDKTGKGNDCQKPLLAWIPGVWFVVVAAVLWSTSGFFTQTSLLDVWRVDLRGQAIAFWRACFALLLLVPLVGRISWDWAMIPMTCCFAVMNWTFLSALVIGSPANTIWMQNLAPCWVMLGAVAIFREKTIGRDWIMLFTCTTGVVFILVMEGMFGFHSPEHRWWGPLLALASGICYAGVILSIRSLRRHDSAWLIALNHLVTAIAIFPLVWMSGVSFPTGWMWPMLAGLGVLQMGLPYFLFARGLKTTPSHLASLIALLEPVLLPVWVHLTRWGDPAYRPPQWWTWVGAGCILVGLTIRYSIPDRSTATATQE